MTDLIESTLHRLRGQLSGRLSRLGDDRYAVATAIWAKPVGPMPRAVAHCRTAQEVQSAIQAARDCDLPLSVRGGGHDWAGRALCDGIVIDLTAMNDVALTTDYRAARISGGARASDVFAVTDPRGLAVVTGSCSSVGMTGLTLGGGYGSLSARFGLALDNLLTAEVVLADGRIVTASSRQRTGTVLGVARRRGQFWRGDRDAPPDALSAQRPLRHAAIPVHRSQSRSRRLYRHHGDCARRADGPARAGWRP